jgi:hypothetical protein
VIADHYTSLVGLSVSRGFTHQVRELFGGPRGCSHTTALLQAMAPVAIQARVAMTRLDPRRDERPFDPRRSINTCHVWAPGGELADDILAGKPLPVPLSVLRRYAELGRTPPDRYL